MCARAASQLIANVSDWAEPSIAEHKELLPWPVPKGAGQDGAAVGACVSHAHFFACKEQCPRDQPGEGQASHLRTGHVTLLMGLNTYLAPVPDLPAGYRSDCHGGQWQKQSLLLLRLFLLPERQGGGGRLG